MKKIVNTALIYAIIAMLCGILYREGSRFLELTESTYWSLTHTHFFVLGMFFFLIVLVLEKEFHITTDKKFNIFYIIISQYKRRGTLQAFPSKLQHNIKLMFSHILTNFITM